MIDSIFLLCFCGLPTFRHSTALIRKKALSCSLAGWAVKNGVSFVMNFGPLPSLLKNGREIILGTN
jgi:hypothetical protein